MKDFRLGNFIPVVSNIVALEIASAPEDVQRTFAELLSTVCETLDVTVEALELADYYQERGILPRKFYDDGLHIALATTGNVDLLVSWNFRHIVRYEKIRLFNAVNLEHGYKELLIYSPREVTNYGDEKEI